jgi:tetratricopeptide (TPR) repeat protein
MASSEVAVAYNSAAASFNAGRVDEALALWASCIDSLAASAAEEGGDEAAAKDLLGKVHVNMGHANLRSGRFEAAIEAYDRCIEDCEVRDAVVYHRRALALRELKRFHEAADWEAAAVDLKEDGDYHEARRGKTACYMALEDWERAEESAREAVEAKDNDLPSVVELGFCLLKGQKYADAAAEFGRAKNELGDISAQTTRLYASSLGLMAEELAKEGELEEAAAAYEAAASVEANVGRVYNAAVLRTRAAERNGETTSDGDQLSQAIAGYRAALAMQPDFFPAHSGLGMAFMSCDEYGAAATALANAVALKDDDPRVRYNLGVAYMKAGQAKDAEPQFANALQLNPGF